MVGCGQEMAVELEEVVDLTMAGEEALGMPWRLELLHLTTMPRSARSVSTSRRLRLKQW